MSSPTDTPTDVPAPSPAADAAGVAAVVYNPIKVDLAAIKRVVSTAEAQPGWGETL